MIPRKQISILAGASGSGKSTFTLQAIRAHLNEDAFPLRFQGKTFAYVVGDRTVGELKGRAEEIGVKIPMVGIVDDHSIPPSLLKDPRQLLSIIIRDRLKEVPDVLILDPLALFLGGSVVDYLSTAQGMIYLNRFAIQHNITLLALHHASKQRTDWSYKRPQDMILGSAALQGFSGDQMVIVEPEEKGKNHRFYSQSHTSPPIDVELEQGSGGWFKVVRGCLNPSSLIGWLGSLDEREWTTGKIHELGNQMGMSRSTINYHIKEWVEQGVLIRPKHGVYVLNPELERREAFTS